jgi:hypothetical protein
MSSPAAPPSLPFRGQGLGYSEVHPHQDSLGTPQTQNRPRCGGGPSVGEWCNGWESGIGAATGDGGMQSTRAGGLKGYRGPHPIHRCKTLATSRFDQGDGGWRQGRDGTASARSSRNRQAKADREDLKLLQLGGSKKNTRDEIPRKSAARAKFRPNRCRLPGSLQVGSLM